MLRRMCASKIEPVFACQCRMCLLLDTLLQISNPLLFFTVFRPVLEANAFKKTGQCRLDLVSICHRNSPYPLMVTATRCNTLQHTAIHCKTKCTTTPPYPLMMVVFWLNHSSAFMSYCVWFSCTHAIQVASMLWAPFTFREAGKFKESDSRCTVNTLCRALSSESCVYLACPRPSLPSLSRACPSCPCPSLLFPRLLWHPFYPRVVAVMMFVCPPRRHRHSIPPAASWWATTVPTPSATLPRHVALSWPFRWLSPSCILPKAGMPVWLCTRLSTCCFFSCLLSLSAAVSVPLPPPPQLPPSHCRVVAVQSQC